MLWLDRTRSHLYGSMGKPGGVDAFDLDPVRASARIQMVKGAHTLTVDECRREMHVLLATSHKDLV